MKKNFKFFAKNCMILTVLLVAIGCASAPQLSPQQRRAIQMRTFEKSSYDNVFRAFKTVLQDEGYLIKNQDMSGGLIVATIEKTDSSSSFWAALGGKQNYRTGEGFEVSVNLERVNETIVESRLTVQKLEQYSLGGRQGHEILDPQIYQALYKKIMVEVERRKAAGKK